MKTSSFFEYHGVGSISIARRAPKAMVEMVSYLPLAPGWWFNSVPLDEYVYRYKTEILARLNPQRVWNDLHELAKGHEPVLLCWEKGRLEGANFCHRVLVSAWFKETLGQDVLEMYPSLF